MHQLDLEPLERQAFDKVVGGGRRRPARDQAAVGQDLELDVLELDLHRRPGVELEGDDPFEVALLLLVVVADLDGRLAYR